MSFYGLSDKAIAEDIGSRLKQLRLNKNYSLQELIELTGLSMKAVRNAEQGKSTLITYIKILRALKSLDNLEIFIPQARVSPLQLAKMAGHKRQRASSKRTL